MKQVSALLLYSLAVGVSLACAVAQGLSAPNESASPERNANAIAGDAQQELERKYAQACAQHNGYISEFGNCVVDYPGWPSQPVTINPDGTWDTFQADINRGDCEINAQDAAMSAHDGSPWTMQPAYHPDTGVCVPGNP